VRFADLDAEFAARHGDISAYLKTHGYPEYSARNVELYAEVADCSTRPEVMALCSGFVTYADDVHPAYLSCRQVVESSPRTFVPLPTQLHTCVTETIRRQLERPFARSAEREEQVIRARFPIHMGFLCRKIATMQPVDAFVTELITALAAFA
jgi:shikimate kinase